MNFINFHYLMNIITNFRKWGTTVYGTLTRAEFRCMVYL